MSEPRNWLCLITSDKEEQNVDELTRDIWEHFDGVCAVVHKQGGGDAVSTLLQERCGEGFMVEAEWLWHHGQSMSRVLLDRRIDLMDCLWWRDSCERLNPAFTTDLKAFAADLLTQNIWNLAQWSKVVMHRRWYNQQIINGLHWGIVGLYGTTIPMERVAAYADDRSWAYSVRNEKRPPTHRYEHELRYLVDYRANGNHLALFHPNAADLDRAQWAFYHYTQWMKARGITTAQQLIDWWGANVLDTQHQQWLNAERPLRNAYRWFILKHTDEQIKLDEDTWRLA